MDPEARAPRRRRGRAGRRRARRTGRRTRGATGRTGAMPKVKLMPVLSLVGVAFAVWFVLSRPTVVPPPPVSPPPKAPYPSTLAGSGVLEPANARTTAIGVPFAGLVLEVFHDVGDKVTKGEPLFRLDDRVPRIQRKGLESRVAIAAA